MDKASDSYMGAKASGELTLEDFGSNKERAEQHMEEFIEPTRRQDRNNELFIRGLVNIIKTNINN